MSPAGDVLSGAGSPAVGSGLLPPARTARHPGGARPSPGAAPGPLGRAGVAGARAGLGARRAGGPGTPVLGAVVMSPWGWRILTVFTMVALGLCLTFFLDAKPVFGALWAVISVAWGLFSWRLWRMHLDWDREPPPK